MKLQQVAWCCVFIIKYFWFYKTEVNVTGKHVAPMEENRRTSTVLLENLIERDILEDLDLV